MTLAAPIAIGGLAAGATILTRLLHASFPSFAWDAQMLLLGVTVIAVLIQRFLIDPRPGHRAYDGLADVFIHIHSPASPDSGARWGLRGLVSLLLALFGGRAGIEGAAIELGHASAIQMRSRSSKWFEQRRRTDAAMAIAAGISAAFGAPFAAVLVPVELGVGGRTLSAALASLTAFLGARALAGWLEVPTFEIGGALYGFQFLGWKEWLCVALITVLGGLIATAAIRFIRYSQESLIDLFQTQAWMRILAGGVMLFLVALVYREGNLPSWLLAEQVLWARRSTEQVGLLFCMQLLSLALVLSAFGTAGTFWPVFALGTFLGFWVDHAILQAIPTFGPVAALAGAAAFWGAVLGAPIAGAVLSYELTHQLNILLPCLVAGLGARQIRAWLRTPPLVEKDLEARGISLVEGRSVSVLDSVSVREAMVTDFDTVHEQEPVSDLHARLLKSRYPFLPVVNSQGVYLGLLTVDIVQEGWQSQDPLASHSRLSKLLEAKDLLYRSGLKVPTVKVTDKLSATAGLFDQVPCVPALGDDGKVLGLLFVYNVRLAYDREVARRALALQFRAQV